MFPTAFSVPNPRGLDPYGLATVEVLKGGWPLALAKKLPILTEDAVSSWSAVEYGLGSPAYGFTGKSQICTNVTGNQEVYEDGSFHHEYVLGHDYVTAIPWTGLKLNRLSNGQPARTPDQESAVNAFVSFLSQVSVQVTDRTSTATLTLNGGKTDLAQHCLH